MKYRKKPIIVEAMKWVGDFYEVGLFCGTKASIAKEWGAHILLIETLEGVMKAAMGDWIIKGIKGEFYPCKPDIFEQTYELLEENYEITNRPKK